jgi:hypothetical protein
LQGFQIAGIYNLSWWQKLIKFFELPALQIAFATILFLLLVGTVFEVVRLRKELTDLQQAQLPNIDPEQALQKQLAEQKEQITELSKKLAQEQELRTKLEKEKLNAQSPSPQTASTVMAFVLSPLSMRSSGGTAQLNIKADIENISLKLELIDRSDYEKFQIVIRQADGKEVFQKSNLQVSKNNRQAITFLISTKVLSTGEYFVKLKGQMGSKWEDIADYSFTVEKND